MRNQISDIAVLANLLNLEDLRLSENKISDISPLSGLENIIYLMAANQEIILPETTVGNSVDFTLANRSQAERPSITWENGSGDYDWDTNQLTWSSNGENKLTWKAPHGIGNQIQLFSGTVTQNVLGGGELWFERVPDDLNFKTTTIRDNLVTISRQNPNWSMSIGDTREIGSTWSVIASIDAPLTSANDHALEGAIVFKGEDGVQKPLSDIEMEVFSGTKGTAVTSNVSWEEDEGVLLHLNPISAGVEANSAYTTTITWTLVDVWEPEL
jgi:hypothetical protein